MLNASMWPWSAARRNSERPRGVPAACPRQCGSAPRGCTRPRGCARRPRAACSAACRVFACSSCNFTVLVTRSSGQGHGPGESSIWVFQLPVRAHHLNLPKRLRTRGCWRGPGGGPGEPSQFFWILTRTRRLGSEIGKLERSFPRKRQVQRALRAGKFVEQLPIEPLSSISAAPKASQIDRRRSINDGPVRSPQ
jgi:hypothetical protein